jgi:uncharacterized membrane protein
MQTHGIRPTQRRQRGSMAVAMMLMLIGLITILGIVEVGYLYSAKRDAQKVADLAALSGVQQLTTPADTCPTAAITSASNNATTNGATTANGYSTPSISCGGQPASSSSMLAPASTSSVAAIKVDVTRNMNHLFGAGMAWTGTHPVSATAVAINTQPIASFSVGSRLVGIGSGSPLNQLLSSALGTQLGLQLLSYNGIANTNISLLNLVNQLNINAGTVNGVLSAPITVTGFLNAYVQALQQSSNAANIDLGFVNSQVSSIEAQIGNTAINLGDILNVNANTTNPNVALNTDVSALDILNAVLLAADSQNAVALNGGSINVPGVATVGLQLAVIAPPQIAVGGVGTTAHTAQVRLALNITALSTPLTGGESLLGVPIYVEVAPADATISSINCGNTQDTVGITATPGLVNAFLGTLPSTAFTNTTSSWTTLVQSGIPAPLIQANVNLLGPLGLPVLQLVTISGSAYVVGTANLPTLLTFDVPTPVSHPLNPPLMQTAGSPSTTSLSTVVTSLLGSSTLQTTATLLGGINVTLPSATLSPLLSILSSALTQPPTTGVLPSLDSLLVSPLLKATGIEIGTADVNLIDVKCNAGPQLVY